MKTIKYNNQYITPSKIVCIGRNYVDHIYELNNEIPKNMVVFLKPNSAITTKLSSFHQESLHYEGELCFLYLNGGFCAVGFGLDLTKRTLQAKLKSKGLPWERAKAFNGSALFSPFVAINDIDDSIYLKLSINEQLVQQGGVKLMMYKPVEILKQLSSFIDLEDGDIVMTGTPKGVGEIKRGSRFCGQVLKNDSVLIEANWHAS